MKKLNPWFILSVIVSLAIWAVIIWAILMLTGCGGMHLNPALEVLNGGKELSDEQVDIRMEKCGWWEVQKECTMFKEHPIASILSIGTIGGCAYLRCGEDKEWDTEKICTCRGYYMFNMHNEHELKHCHGWIH